MGRREDFYKTLNHEQPESLIVDLGGCPNASMEGRSMYMLMEYLGIPVGIIEDPPLFGNVRKIDERVLKHFDIDTRSVGELFCPSDSLFEKTEEKVYTDEWGIKRAFTGMYWDIIEYPLKNATLNDLENYRWPDPDSINMEKIEAHAKKAKKLFEETDYIICAEHPVYGIFELGCWMCGFDDFLLKMAMEEEFIHRFFEIILDYQKRVIKKYYGALGKYIHYTTGGDDFATQISSFMSPAMFCQFIKPYFKERIEYTKTFTNAAFLHHSCGSIIRLINDLKDCGVDIINPIQPKAADMQPEKLKLKFGGKVVFHGGIDTQDILPNGTKESIEKNVKNTIDIMNKDGGYILAAAHNIQEDVPPQNLAYMLEAAKKFGGIDN